MPDPKNDVPAISVIMPVFNAEQYLYDSLLSLTKQSFKNFEAVIADDCSTDESAAILRKFSETDRRFKIIFLKKNGGPAAARNAALNSASGETVLFLDADDILADNALTVLYTTLKHENSDICAGIFSYFNSEGEIPVPFAFPDHPFSLDKQGIFQVLVNQMRSPNKEFMFAYMWGRLFKHSIIQNIQLRFDEEMWTYEDLKFVFQLASAAEKLSFVPEKVYHYRIHNTGKNISMGIFSNHNRLMDLFSFYKTMIKILSASNSVEANTGIADNCMVNLAIIHIVRYCQWMNFNNILIVYRHVRSLVKNDEFTAALKNYDGNKPGRSKLMPLLMRKRLYIAILLLGKYKAIKRYGKDKKS